MEIPAELESQINEVITHYPVSKRSATMPVLHLIQEHFGYIEDPAKSVTELTFLLGFSGQSAFTRAFRRWTGASPTEYRAHRKTRRTPAR